MSSLKNRIAIISKQIEAANREISQYPEGYLVVEKDRKYIKCTHVRYENGVRIRKSMPYTSETVRMLARKRYLQILTERLNQELKALKYYDKNHTEISSESTLKNLPHNLQELPVEYFLDGIPSANEDLHEFSIIKADIVTEWEKSRYECSKYKEEERNKRTSRGLLVRSKSEIIIAEKLYEYNIAFHYEEILHIGEKVFYPDFTIMLNNGTKYYWEHCGLTGNAAYMKHHRDKLEWYEKVGITEWNNLVITYDDVGGNFDVGIADGIIRTIILRDRKQWLQNA